MFGWGEFREDENIGRKMLRKTMFSIVWQIEEIRKESSGDYFLYRVHKFLPPKLGGKAWREFSHRTFIIIPSSTYLLHKHNTTVVRESSKKEKRKKQRAKAGVKKERMRALLE